MREHAFPEGLFCAMKTFLSGWKSRKPITSEEKEGEALVSFSRF
jgi:hypothetical protein